MPQAVATSQPRPGVLPDQHPDNKTTTATETRIASRVPARLARKLDAISPRTKCDHDVVIPHAGQRIPQIIRIEQGGNPSCWCVPNPAGFGRNHAAMASGDASEIAPTNITIRKTAVAPPVTPSLASFEAIRRDVSSGTVTKAASEKQEENQADEQFPSIGTHRARLGNVPSCNRSNSTLITSIVRVLTLNRFTAAFIPAAPVGNVWFIVALRPGSPSIKKTSLAAV